MKGKVKDIVEFITVVSVLLILSFLIRNITLRFDLTSDKRHSLSEATTDILHELNEDIYIQVYLDGDMRVEFTRLKRELKSKLDEFRVISGKKLDYSFINPSESEDPEERTRYQMSLVNKGLVPVTIMAEDKEGEQSEKTIFPGLIVNYNGIEIPINFLRNNPALPAEQNLMHSIEGLEYELISSIATVTSDTIHKIAFIEGHGELQEVEVADLTLELAKFFTIDRGTIGGKPGVLDSYSAIVFAKPQEPFNEDDKLVIDQYIMNGGKVLWLIDEVVVNRDSLASGGSLAFYKPLEIEDQLFRYGVRINPVLIQDQDCQTLSIVGNFSGARQQALPVPWIYNPLLYPSSRSPVTRAINKVRGEFTNYIDTVGTIGEINKQVLLATSPQSRYVSPPRMISLEEFRDPPPLDAFDKSFLPVAVLLEGRFTSIFKNRVRDYNGREIKEESEYTRMIVVSDGDIIRNEVQRDGNRLIPLTLGQDRLTQQIYGNKDFLVNALNYLVDDKGIMDLRSRELKLRLLDEDKIHRQKSLWQLINIAGPVLLVIIAALLYSWIRRRRVLIKQRT
ncbi:MAG: gliding motility-associated ABC transporter substrate-binding protein GldG [Bacteroidales bacterium]|nr:gliding motility-associated ABC transporter substrate-binding protein GldG [Bacteroidales bacterium]